MNRHQNYFYEFMSRAMGTLPQGPAAALEKHHLYGSIFETRIMTEIKKNRFNSGINEGMYFFRDSAGKRSTYYRKKVNRRSQLKQKLLENSTRICSVISDTGKRTPTTVHAS
ncbi:hypothetical protein [Niabella aurantiaca]|uniref:hypothetical protein n=1 Tax=Niabella aurantiaca TaxID=379900 RepID=UPI000382CD59|nr:hypothetical protein [Niabella aurantiaca]